MPSDVLFAIKKGSLPARLQKSAADEGAAGWPAEVVLRLGGEPLTILGRVVDNAGKPVSDARVWVFDGTFAGRVDRTTSTVQGLILGAPTRSAMMKMVREGGADPQEVMRKTATAMWPFVHSGSDGSFKIEGLVERDYVLRAMVNDTLLMTEVAGVRAGRTDVELRFGAESYYKKLSGRVVSKRGRPIANAEICTMCDPAIVDLGAGRSTQHRTAQHGRTDKDGRFSFKSVPRNLVYIRVDDDDIVPIEFGRRNEGGLSALVGDNLENIVIEVDARVHVKVVVADANRADSFAMLDADGKELVINQFQGRGRTERRHQSLHDGKSGVVVVPETATKIVLYKGAEKVDESSIDLILGEVNEIRR